ncbi:MAG: DUF58 domain-containing protein [Verrucomicrobia bacterium]|nr:DUF58 domain-containing protein [Verrucomicrobiota bacterium]
MIAPSSRLLTWTALLVVPFATIAGLLSDSVTLAVGMVLLFLLLALLDAVLGLGALNGIRVELPKVIRLSKDRAGELALLIHNEPQTERRVRLGLALPRELASPQEDLLVQLPPRAALARVTWPATPSRRGNYRLDTCYLEAASPLGLWTMRGATPIETEIRVYPNLLTERKSVAALFLNRGNLGSHALRQIGKGRDFEKLREYVPGDSYDDIHWKATARRGRPVTKVFQIERTQEVYVVIDSSRLTARRVSSPLSVVSGAGAQLTTDHGPLTTDISVLERFLTSALVLGLAAEQQGDLFGLITFSDKVQNFVRAKNGKAHYSACRDAIYTLQPQTVTPDFEEVCSFLRVRLRKRALVVFLTALDDPLLAESFTRSIDLICRQHLVLVNMMQPPGARPLFSNPDVTRMDELYQELGGHMQWHQLRELGKTLERRGVKFAALEDERLTAQLVSQYLEVKRRQIL